MRLAFPQTHGKLPEENKSISEAQMVEKVINEPGFIVLMNRLNDLRSEALYAVMALDVESLKYRERLRTIDEIIGLPAEIIMKGKLAQQEELDE